MLHTTIIFGFPRADLSARLPRARDVPVVLASTTSQSPGLCTLPLLTRDKLEPDFARSAKPNTKLSEQLKNQKRAADDHLPPAPNSSQCGFAATTYLTAGISEGNTLEHLAIASKPQSSLPNRAREHFASTVQVRDEPSAIPGGCLTSGPRGAYFVSALLGPRAMGPPSLTSSPRANQFYFVSALLGANFSSMAPRSLTRDPRSRFFGVGYRLPLTTLTRTEADSESAALLLLKDCCSSELVASHKSSGC